MTRRQAIAELVRQQKNSDGEEAHIKADTVLVTLLNSLGYEDVTEQWENVRKWYS